MTEYLVPELIDGKLHPSVLPEGGGGGADGASAYEVAVANGFVGSEAEWLSSLKGDKGDKGDPGNDLTHSTPQAINAQTGTAYTLVAADAGKLVTLANPAVITLTVPPGVFTAGQRVDCSQRGTGAVTVVGGAGVTLNPGPGMTLVSEGQHAAWTVLFLSATVADVIGWMAAA